MYLALEIAMLHLPLESENMVLCERGFTIARGLCCVQDVDNWPFTEDLSRNIMKRHNHMSITLVAIGFEPSVTRKLRCTVNRRQLL